LDDGTSNKTASNWSFSPRRTVVRAGTNWSFALRRTGVRAGLTPKTLLSISRSRSGHSSRRGFDRAKAGPAKLLLQSDRIKKGRTPRY